MFDSRDNDRGRNDPFYIFFTKKRKYPIKKIVPWSCYISCYILKTRSKNISKKHFLLNPLTKTERCTYSEMNPLKRSNTTLLL